MAQRSNAPKKSTSPKQYIGYGVLLLLGAVAAFFYIGHAEQSGGTITMPVILLPVYKLLGKLGIATVLGLAGAGSLGLGLTRLKADSAKAASTTPTNPVP